ncbi:MAG TPA: hypothetical protein VN364_11070, partial [Bellilinea sp.]|nr:hypothetical protein [Bellilinea sp.]
LLLAYLLLAGGILWQLLEILHLNNGFFVYPLDDTYIHLALAENIAHRTYGVNLGEFSAPSSSIIWPILLAPVAQFEIAPLIYNILATIFAVYIFYLILDNSITVANHSLKQVIVFTFLILLIPTTNIIPLVFLGLEHSLQVLSIAIICLGLLLNLTRHEVNPWLLWAIVIAPLVRYENGAVSMAALLFLFLRKNYRTSILTALATVIPLIGFTAFLRVNGGGWLPASVIVKTGFTSYGDATFVLFDRLSENVLQWSGAVILICALIFLIYLFAAKNESKKKLAFVMVIATGVFLLFGQVARARYEVFFWVFALMGLIILFGVSISQIFDQQKSRLKLAAISAAGILVFVLASLPYLFLFPLWPSGSNNIYSQQYQMHRFVVDYYQGPVAVNDLGYVAYKNDQYVLDLWGLAYLEAYQSRMANDGQPWMDRLVKQKNVHLVMIYESVYNKIPPNWEKVGDLVMTRGIFTNPIARVGFYAVTPADRLNITGHLYEFIKTLPETAKFEFSE